MLDELCADGACAGITANPVADVARLAAQLRQPGAQRASPTTAPATATQVAMSELDLFAILEAGDLNPALRALLPAAVRSALHHDPDPLLRLTLLARG